MDIVYHIGRVVDVANTGSRGGAEIRIGRRDSACGIGTGVGRHRCRCRGSLSRIGDVKSFRV